MVMNRNIKVPRNSPTTPLMNFLSIFSFQVNTIDSMFINATTTRAIENV